MDVQLTAGQYSFLTSTAPISFFLAGIGTGKSWCAAHVILNHIIKYPKSNILLVANTHQQLLSATVPAVLALLDDVGLQYTSAMAGSKKHITMDNGVIIFLYSLENFQNIRGIEVGLVVGDEIAYSKREAFDVIMGRLRCKHGSLKARFCSSPNGFNWVYDLISAKKAEWVTGKTTDNIFLPPEYHLQLLELYGGASSPLYQQECEGKFVNLTSGAVYYAFDRTKNTKKLSLNPNLPVYVGLDFNIENMTFTYCQWIDGCLHVIKEVVLDNNSANTFDAAIKIRQDLSVYQVKIVPDSTGKSRKTSAETGRSDITILKDAGLTVMDTSNPRIKDRHNSMNALFMKGKCVIDESCSKLIKELETLKHSDTEGDVAHLSVGVGYVAWQLAPLKPAQAPSKTISNPFFQRK